MKGSIRVSAPSYSIKALEPLYMGDQLRDKDGVTSGGDSILAYQQYREQRVTEPLAAEKHLHDLEEYNRYDCLSTLRLRDWLLDRAREAGVSISTTTRADDEPVDPSTAADPDGAYARKDLLQRLGQLAGEGAQAERSAEQQGFAMLASALHYFRLERKVFWWEHYSRLQYPISEWAETRDVFVVESAMVEQEWFHPGGKAENYRRKLRLTGDWSPGSGSNDKAHVIYQCPNPPGVSGPGSAPYGAGKASVVESSTDDRRTVWLTESRPHDQIFPDLPIALTPGDPPPTRSLEEAVERLATEAASAGHWPSKAVFDMLIRRTPRTATAGLARGSDRVACIVASLVSMQDSYLAVQGPPGTGKTHTGSRVIKVLVEKHGWRIGVVAQSHAVVENMLAAVATAGLDSSKIGKSEPQTDGHAWKKITNTADARARFLKKHHSSGCVLGGTAWTFASEDLLTSGQLDLLVIDEAGQFSLAATMAASVAAKRLLLLGDPQQLPQISQATHADAIDESALGWLMEGHDTLPPTLGYFLSDSYRMHPALCSRVSALSYERRLRSAVEAGERRLEGIAPGIGVIQVQHTGNRTESIDEARVIVREIRALLGTRWSESPNDVPRPLGSSDFLVVAPYNAQVSLIRRELELVGLSTIRVGTVDKFQGQEAPIALLSMTASSHGDVPRGMAFLVNRNRLNVAVSRAKWRAIIVHSTCLTNYMPGNSMELLELGSFVGLCC